jgi:hypothetical protein
MTEEIVITNVNIPPVIATAVLTVQMKLGILGKEDKNEYQNYAFVSIDKYYETVARVATEHGLSWFCQETEPAKIVNFGEGKAALLYNYQFTMFFRDGEVVPVYDRISIFHPLQGAQTSGSAASYAEKLFMRKAFKVVTGEKDADAVDQDFGGTNPGPADLDLSPPDPTPEPSPSNVKKAPEEPKLAPEKVSPVSKDPSPKAPAPVEKTGTDEISNPADYVITDEDGTTVIKEIKEPEVADWSLVFNVFETFLPDCKSMKDTKEFWTKNTKAIELLKDGDPKAHKKLVAMFKEHQSNVSTKGK